MWTRGWPTSKQHYLYLPLASSITVSSRKFNWSLSSAWIVFFYLRHIAICAQDHDAWFFAQMRPNRTHVRLPKILIDCVTLIVVQTLLWLLIVLGCTAVGGHIISYAPPPNKRTHLRKSCHVPPTRSHAVPMPIARDPSFFSNAAWAI
jgi:hypothetical protein